MLQLMPDLEYTAGKAVHVVDKVIADRNLSLGRSAGTDRLGCETCASGRIIIDHAIHFGCAAGVILRDNVLDELRSTLVAWRFGVFGLRDDGFCPVIKWVLLLLTLECISSDAGSDLGISTAANRFALYQSFFFRRFCRRCPCKAILRLLHNMCKLVCNELISFAGAWGIGPGAKYYILAHGIRQGVDCRCRLGRLRVGMRSHPAEVLPKARFHSRPR